MKRLLVFCGAFMVTGCTSIAPSQGEEAVVVRKPWFWGHGGVASDPVKTGRSYFALSTYGVIVNMQPEQYGVHFEDLMTSDGVPLDFDAVVRTQVVDSVKLIRDFGPEWFKKNVEQEFRTLVRQSVRQHGLNETAINAKAIDQIDAEVTAGLEANLKASGVPIRLIAVTVGRANPPDAIKHQRIATAEQEQRVNTEKQRKLAEDQRLAAEQSRAAADNAYREAMKLSPDQFLQLKSIDTMAWACASKPGTCTFYTTGAIPFFGIK